MTLAQIHHKLSDRPAKFWILSQIGQNDLKSQGLKVTDSLFNTC